MLSTYSDKLNAVTLEMEWLEAGRILKFTFADSSQTTVDLYCAWYLEVMQNHPIETPMLHLLVFTNNDFVITNYFRRQIIAIDKQTAQRGINGRVAVVVREGIVATVAIRVIRMLRLLITNVMRPRVFTDQQQALAWLHESP